MKLSTKINRSLSERWLTFCCGFYFLYAQNVYAVTDKIKLPNNVKVDGVSSESNILDIIVAVGIVIVKVIIWVIVLIAGIVLLMNIVKSMSAVRDNKRDGGSAKWGEVISDIIGSSVTFILVLLVAVLIQTYF